MKRFCLALFFLLVTSVPVHAATYTVAYDATWPPFEFLNKNKGIAGYTADYINVVSREAKFTASNIHVPWDGIFTYLTQGGCQIIASSVTITEERRKSFAFTIPYFETYQHLLLPAASKATKIGDLQNAVLGAQTGTVGQDIINSHKGLNAKLYDDLTDAIDELIAGKIHGVVCDYPVGQYYAHFDAYKGKIKPAPFKITDKKDQFGFVVRKNDKVLLEALNKAIRSIQKKQIDREIYTKWFGQGKPVH